MMKLLVLPLVLVLAVSAKKLSQEELVKLAKLPKKSPAVWLAKFSTADNGQLNAVTRLVLSYKTCDRLLGSNAPADTTAQWNFATNTIKANNVAASKADGLLATFTQNWADEALTYKQANLFNAPFTADQQRQFNKITDMGIKLNASETQTLSNYVNQMSSLYAGFKLCPYATYNASNATACNATLALDPNIFHILATSKNYSQLSYVWNQWRAKNSALKSTWLKFMKLSNAGAQAGGYNDTGAYWRSWYEQGNNFTTNIQTLFNQILPLYETLHAYVRSQLKQSYPNRWNSSTIPAHILGNMWGQEWQNIAGTTAPLFPGVPILDVTAAMTNQSYTPTRMFRTAESFFSSIGLSNMTSTFWAKSQYTKPNRNPPNFICHASAWDFYQTNDFRIKMCTSVDMNNLITIHHEMGHIEYYMQYQNQPSVYRQMCTSVDMNNLITIHHEMGHIEYFMQYAPQPSVYRTGANPGFHEAIGDTIALSVATPTHLKKIGLLPANYTINHQADLNFLYKQAMEKIAFLPWGYLMDKWRWDVFAGKYNASNMNQYWWKLRYQLQGLNPPVARPPNAFDPASKSHIDDNTPYIRYFVSFIVQFQFYESMCKAANNTLPLHLCDFYQNQAAGHKLKQMLSMGASKPWPQAMQVLTNQTQMDAGSITRYFQPLMNELQSRLKSSCDCYGWGNDQMYSPALLKTLPKPRCNKVWQTPKCKVTKPPPPKPSPTSGAQSVFQTPMSILLLTVLGFLSTFKFL